MPNMLTDKIFLEEGKGKVWGRSPELQPLTLKATIDKAASLILTRLPIG